MEKERIQILTKTIVISSTDGNSEIYISGINSLNQFVGQISYRTDESVYDECAKEFQKIIKKLPKEKVFCTDFNYYLDYSYYPMGDTIDRVTFVDDDVTYYEEMTPDRIKKLLVNHNDLKKEEISDEVANALCEVFNKYITSTNKRIKESINVVIDFKEKLLKNEIENMNIDEVKKRLVHTTVTKRQENSEIAPGL